MSINKTKLLKLYIALYPVCDMLYTLSDQLGIADSLNISQLLRGFGLLLTLLYIRKNTRALLKLTAIGIWMIISLFVYRNHGLSTSIFSDFTLMLKLFTAFATYFAFKEIFESEKMKIDEVLSLYVFSAHIAIASILLSYIGLGMSSYGTERMGVKGLFTIQSTITGYLLILFPAFYYKYGKILCLPIILAAAALMSIGSKTGMLGTVLCYLIFVIYDVYYDRRKQHKRIVLKRSTLRNLLIIMGAGISFGYVFLKKYIMYLLELYRTKAYYHSLDSFLLSNRNDFINIVVKYIHTAVPLDMQRRAIVFGYGGSAIELMLSKSWERLSFIERDFHGLYYYYGVVLFAVVAVILCKAVIKGFRENFKHKFRDKLMFCSLLMLGIGIVYGWLGGHVLYEAMNLFPFWIFCAYINSRKFTERSTDI